MFLPFNLFPQHSLVSPPPIIPLTNTAMTAVLSGRRDLTRPLLWGQPGPLLALCDALGRGSVIDAGLTPAAARASEDTQLQLASISPL